MTGVLKIILGDAFGKIGPLEYFQVTIESTRAVFLCQKLVHGVIHRGYVGRAQGLQDSVNAHWIRLRCGDWRPASVGPGLSRSHAKAKAQPLLRRVALQNIRRSDGSVDPSS